METFPPPGPDVTVAQNFLIPCGILTVLASSLCFARIWTRLRPSPHLSPSDYMIAVAEILSLATYFSSVAAAAYGWGHPAFYVSPEHQVVVKKCMFVNTLGFLATLALIRISVALTLMPFSPSKVWKSTLWSVIVFHIIVTSGWFITVFFECRPLRISWEPVAHFTCWTLEFELVFGWLTAAIFMVIDLILALLPLHLIRTLNRPRREKILVGCLMAMGLITTTISGLKMTTYTHPYAGDPLQITVRSTMWAKLEELMGITAACAPCLKAPAERLLRQFGLISQKGPRLSKPSFVVSQKDGAIDLAPTNSIPAEAEADTVVEGRGRDSYISLNG